jgi:integrase/recombinase XerD
MERVWSAIAQRTETQLRDFAMVQLLSHNLRAGEVASANVGSFDGRLVTLTQTKNKQPRIVPLSEAGQQAIQAYLEWRRGQGETLTPDSPLIYLIIKDGRAIAWAIVVSILQWRGLGSWQDWLPELHPHQFRYTGATELLRMGMDPAQFIQVMGEGERGSDLRRYGLSGCLARWASI